MSLHIFHLLKKIILPKVLRESIIKKICIKLISVGVFLPVSLKGGGVEYVQPIFVCENIRKIIKIMHCVELLTRYGHFSRFLSSDYNFATFKNMYNLVSYYC